MSTTMVMGPKNSINSPRRLPFPRSSNADTEEEYQRAIINFLAAKDRPFIVSGTIPLSADQPLILFFRTSSGISHSLPFPLKTDSLHQLPALNVLLAACENIPDATMDESVPITENTEHELPLVWPSKLPFSTTFELSNHPVLDAVRSVLFPKCYPGTYLFAQRSRLEIILAGARSEPRRPSSSHGVDGTKLVATLVVTLPVPHRGGALVVYNPEGVSEHIVSSSRLLDPNGDAQLHWSAFLADCEHEIEFVEQGCRISISYAIYMKTFGPVGPRPNPLITPGDELLDTLSTVLNLSRGRRLGIYLTGRYDCSPSEILADSLVPSLKGSDAVLYHALRLYKLTPELHWAAAGYIWPVDKTVQLGMYHDRDDMQSVARANVNYPYSAPNSPLSQGARHYRQRRKSVSRSVASYDGNFMAGMTVADRMNMSIGSGTFGQGAKSLISDEDEDNEDDNLRDRVMEGGALLLRDTDILVLTARDQGVSKEKVPFVSRGFLDKLLVNILLVTYVQ